MNSLAPGALHTVTVKGGTGGVKDLAGNPMTADFVLTWTTGVSSDAGPPTVLGTTVPDGAVNVPINTRIGATFSEGMDPLTITNVNCTLAETLSGTLAVAATVSYSGVSLEFVLIRFGPAEQIAAGSLSRLKSTHF